MTKRRKSKGPAKPRVISPDPTPMKITTTDDGLNLAALKLEANNDVKAEGANRKHVERARRLDVFQLFLDRGAVPEEHVTAVRALELLIHTAAGAGGTTEAHEHVSGGGCAELVSQRMIDADRRSVEVLTAIMDAETVQCVQLLGVLLSPFTNGSALTRWRDHVAKIAGVTEKNAQGDVIRWLCASTHAAFGDLGYAERRRA